MLTNEEKNRLEKAFFLEVELMKVLSKDHLNNIQYSFDESIPELNKRFIAISYVVGTGILDKLVKNLILLIEYDGLSDTDKEEKVYYFFSYYGILPPPSNYKLKDKLSVMAFIVDHVVREWDTE